MHSISVSVHTAGRMHSIGLLYTSIMSPRNHLYFKICKFNRNKRSLYGNFLNDITNFVALF